VAVLISYVDDGTIIVQSDTWDKNLVKLKSAYKIVFELTQSMGLVLEHNKSEGFHFSRKHGDSNPDINLGYAPYTGATPLLYFTVPHLSLQTPCGDSTNPCGVRTESAWSPHGLLGLC
jgi:hypothetical protein